MTEMPMHNDSPFYGYNVGVIQDQYAVRDALGVVGFLSAALEARHERAGLRMRSWDDYTGDCADCSAGQGRMAATWSRAWSSAPPRSRRARTSTT